MKKILVMMTSMFLGGAERSLLGLLEAIDTTEYQVDLFLFRHEGELLNLIPEKINLLDEIPEWTTFDRPIVDVLRSWLWPCAIERLLGKAYQKVRPGSGVWKSLQYTSKYLTSILPQIPGHYDMAVSFIGVPFFMKKVDADIKLAWVHTDYDQLDPDRALDEQAYALVDYIVNVSDDCERVFLKHYPNLKEKSLMIENILPTQAILRQSQQDVEQVCLEMPGDGSIRLLTIGRFSPQKKMDEIPDICDLLLKMGFNVKWYLIGYGGEEALIRRKIAEANMEDHVIMLGKKDNPYPYIKNCDVYAQPSRYEGKCVAVREAQMLGKPVIITNYATAKSQLEDGVDGVVVPMDIQGCAEGIAKVLRDDGLRERLIQNCRQRDYSNAGEIEKLYEIIRVSDAKRRLL